MIRATEVRADHSEERPHMKITDIRVIHVRIQHPNTAIFDGSYDDCLVLVDTDEGITGVAEVDSLPAAIGGVILGPSAHSHARGLREALLGEDPLDPPRLWELMYRATDYVGRRGLILHAIAGIDIALWDIKGKAADKPVHELLGGVRRDRVPVYGTIYPLERTAEGVAEQIEDARALNLRAFKLAADPWWMDDLGLTRDLLRAAREAAGADARLIVDAALSYDTTEEALRLVPLLQEIGVWFLEAPLPLDDVEGHARLADCGIPLGVGDLGFTHVNEFLEMTARGHADIWQADVTLAGGITGILRIADAARERAKLFIPHSHKTNLALAANLHVLAVLEQESILETSLSRSPLRWEMTLESLNVEGDGTMIVPQRPGLGVSLNEEAVERYRWQD